MMTPAAAAPAPTQPGALADWVYERIDDDIELVGPPLVGPPLVDPQAQVVDPEPQVVDAAPPVPVNVVDLVPVQNVDDVRDDLAFLTSLAAEARAAAATAVHVAEQTRVQELRDTGRRMAQEQQRLYRRVMADLPEAVLQAAARGERTVAVLEFEGAHKFDEFTYLYMLRGPQSAEDRAEMRAMGVHPLLHRLRRALTPAGFLVRHVWDKATHNNSLVVSW